MGKSESKLKSDRKPRWGRGVLIAATVAVLAAVGIAAASNPAEASPSKPSCSATAFSCI